MLATTIDHYQNIDELTDPCKIMYEALTCYKYDLQSSFCNWVENLKLAKNWTGNLELNNTLGEIYMCHNVIEMKQDKKEKNPLFIWPSYKIKFEV